MGAAAGRCVAVCAGVVDTGPFSTTSVEVLAQLELACLAWWCVSGGGALLGVLQLDAAGPPVLLLMLLVDAAELLSKELTLHVLLLTAPALPARSGSGFTGKFVCIVGEKDKSHTLVMISSFFFFSTSMESVE